MKELSDEQAQQITDLETFEANVVFRWRGVVYHHGDYCKFVRDLEMFLNSDLDEDFSPSL